MKIIAPKQLMENQAPVMRNGGVFSRASLDLQFARTRTLDSRITFTRGSSGTYTDAAGIIRTAGNNVARFDHNPATGQSLGLLVENQSTNLITNSDLLSNFNTTSLGADNSSVVTATAPDNGTQVFQLLTDSSEPRCRIKSNATSSNEVTVSVFVKKNTHRYVQIGFGGGTNSFCALFDIEPGVTNRLISQNGTGTFTNIAASYQDYANGWVRIWAVGTSSGTDGMAIAIVEDETKTKFNSNSVFDGTESVYLWGAQYEDDFDIPTSYISTGASTETRTADLFSITGTNFSSWYNQTEGTVFIDFIVNGDKGANQFIYDIAGGNDIDEEVFVFKSADTDDSKHSVRSSATGQAVFNDDNQSGFNSQIKSAFGMSATSTNRAVNGSLGTVDTSATMPTVDNMKIGRRSNGSARAFTSIARFTYWPTRLSDDTLQQITS